MVEFSDLHLERGRQSIAEINALRSLVIPMANSLLKREIDCVSSLTQVGEQCRQIGAHCEAGRIYDRITKIDPKNTHAQRLRSILLGEFSPNWSKEPGPVPFVQLRNLLCDEARKFYLEQALRDLDKFEDAEVYSSAAHTPAPNKNLRRGKVLATDHVPTYQKRFLPHLKSIVQSENILARLGITNIPNLRFEVQVTSYSDREFFARHVDDGTPSLKGRKVSYVYYMRRPEGEFTGGDLLLYDSATALNNQSMSRYTRVRPLDNSIVFFLSSSAHEVLPTFVKNGNREDGRFSINGWLVKSE